MADGLGFIERFWFSSGGRRGMAPAAFGAEPRPQLDAITDCLRLSLPPF